MITEIFNRTYYATAQRVYVLYQANGQEWARVLYRALAEQIQTRCATDPVSGPLSIREVLV